MISLEKLQILAPLQKLPKNVGDLGKLIVAKGFKSSPKSNKLPNLVILVERYVSMMVAMITLKLFPSEMKVTVIVMDEF